jgi:hypothetical protein
MSIEFYCPFCQKLLKTPDEKAGVKANCPGCGEPVTVPLLQSEAAHPDPSLAVAGDAAAQVSAPPPVESPVAEEMRTDAGATKLCPMCGAEIKKAARRCRFCGEDLVERDGGASDGRLEAGNILTRSWDIFQKNVGLLVGSTLVLMGIALVAVLIGDVAVVVAFVSIAGTGPGGGQGPSAAAIATLVSGAILFVVLMFAINAFLQAGFHILLMRIARGERAELGDLFAGTRFFWRLFWGNILFTLMTYAGFALLIVPGFFVILIFWPFSFVIVDQNTGVVESLRKAKDLMTGNLLAVFILGLAAIGINILGQMACYVGMIFSVPFSSLIFAVAYCRMVRQIPHVRQTATAEA